MPTQRAKVHDARESDDPEFPRVDDVATIELEERASDSWISDCSIEQRNDQ